MSSQDRAACAGLSARASGRDGLFARGALALALAVIGAGGLGASACRADDLEDSVPLQHALQASRDVLLLVPQAVRQDCVDGPARAEQHPGVRGVQHAHPRRPQPGGGARRARGRLRHRGAKLRRGRRPGLRRRRHACRRRPGRRLLCRQRPGRRLLCRRHAWRPRWQGCRSRRRLREDAAAAAAVSAGRSGLDSVPGGWHTSCIEGNRRLGRTVRPAPRFAVAA